MAALPDFFHGIDVTGVAEDEPCRLDSVGIERIENLLRMLGGAIVEGEVNNLLAGLHVICALAGRGSILCVTGEHRGGGVRRGCAHGRIRSLLRRARRGRRILTRVRVIVRTGEEPHDAGECDDDEYGNDKQKAVAWRTCVGGAVRLLSLAALAILIALALAYRPARLRILLALRVA